MKRDTFSVLFGILVGALILGVSLWMGVSHMVNSNRTDQASPVLLTVVGPAVYNAEGRAEWTTVTWTYDGQQKSSSYFGGEPVGSKIQAYDPGGHLVASLPGYGNNRPWYPLVNVFGTMFGGILAGCGMFWFLGWCADVRTWRHNVRETKRRRAYVGYVSPHTDYQNTAVPYGNACKQDLMDDPVYRAAYEQALRELKALADPGARGDLKPLRWTT
jgi:hypothetical protein